MSIQATEDPDTLKHIYTNKNTFDMGRSIRLSSFMLCIQQCQKKATEGPNTLKEIYTNKNTFDRGQKRYLQTSIPLTSQSRLRKAPTLSKTYEQ